MRNLFKMLPGRSKSFAIPPTKEEANVYKPPIPEVKDKSYKAETVVNGIKIKVNYSDFNGGYAVILPDFENANAIVPEDPGFGKKEEYANYVPFVGDASEAKIMFDSVVVEAAKHETVEELMLAVLDMAGYKDIDD